ncbi:nuclear transport factor 2 family protein [Marivirga arenosa]|uniref:Ester cyclase n=1 Tax=Marivirga arenosa TaxID=3059076 RepID=A0AA49JHL9_9BACT|nr:ester cyclase [Marivirga sp. BKB1-2]WKK81261.2 ester cyclase [Marivirga sp. BKB1-2]
MKDNIARLAAIKNNAIAFYEMAFTGKPAKAVELYVGDQYIQHNPLVENGTDGFIRYFEKMQVKFPNKQIDFARAVAEDDLVALHTHQVWAGDGEYITMDFFRFDEKEKIVEHWDSIQKIPSESANPNTMY